MNKDNFELENEIQETPKKKYADLDLGLDFDLSFLDEVDETVLEEAPKEETSKKPVPEKKAAPVKKEAAAKKAAPAAKEASAKKAAPAKKAVAEDAAPTAPKKAPAKKPAAKEETPAAPAKKAKKQPAPQEAPAKPKKKQKKGPRVGSVIFYTLYFIFILAFFVALYFGLNWLHGWLTDFELSQPTLKAQQVFNEVFTTPDWGALYDSAGAQDSPYEGKEEYVTYMQKKVGDTPLTYMETSAGLDKSIKKYNVRLGNEKVATFTLKDRNYSGDKSLDNLENITDIPDWVLGAVEVFFVREEVYNIVKLNGHTAYVNDVPLDDSFTIQKATTRAEEYLPAGTTGFVLETQQVTGLMEAPTVTVKDEKGNVMEVTYDEATRTYTERTESNTMSEEEKAVALKAAEVSSLWMIEAIRDRGEVAKYFEASSDAYNTIVKSTELWVQDYSGYEFVDQTVTDYARYSDNLFSVRVKMTLNVTRTNGTVKPWSFDQSMFFQKGASGKWLCFESTNKNVSEPVGKVRLTFMQGENQLHTDFYETNAKEVITPNFSIPAGQVFSGWITIHNQDGQTIYNLEFVPDETGVVKLPEGTTLKPMTLYALIQNESEVQEIQEVPDETTPAETAPAETAATESVPAETAAETTPYAENAPAETTEGA